MATDKAILSTLEIWLVAVSSYSLFILLYDLIGHGYSRLCLAVVLNIKSFLIVHGYQESSQLVRSNLSPILWHQPCQAAARGPADVEGNRSTDQRYPNRPDLGGCAADRRYWCTMTCWGPCDD